MTSPGHKIGLILKLIYLSQYLSYSIDQKLKMSEMLMAIFLVYSTSGITSGKKSLSGWITLFEIAGQRSTSQAYWVTLALISNIANYLKYNYFLDCDGIDNVTLRLWKFSDFCSRHTVGVAGDGIMFHILVFLYFLFLFLSSFVPVLEKEAVSPLLITRDNSIAKHYLVFGFSIWYIYLRLRTTLPGWLEHESMHEVHVRNLMRKIN